MSTATLTEIKTCIATFILTYGGFSKQHKDGPALCSAKINQTVDTKNDPITLQLLLKKKYLYIFHL